MKGIVVALSVVLVVGGCSGSQDAGSDASEPAVATSPSTPTPRAEISGDGTFAVGTEMGPGVWRSAGRRDGEQCQWRRVSELDGADIADNTNPDGPQTVQILPGDTAFETKGCQPWSRIG
jgi:hypothetical protein